MMDLTALYYALSTIAAVPAMTTADEVRVITFW
jgi:hypothetical protein